MKVRDSGMPNEDLWTSFFDADAVLDALGLSAIEGDVIEIGCGYGTFTIPIARRCSGSVHAFDIDTAMVELSQTKAASTGVGKVLVALRDVLAQGTGRADSSAAAVLLFNILHAEEPIALLIEAGRVLAPGGVVAVIHWRCDIATPRGPDLSIRPRPEQCVAWGEAAGLVVQGGVVELPPWHYGLRFAKRSDGR